MIGIEVKKTIDLDAPNGVRRGYKRFLEDGAQKGFAVSLDHVPEDRGTLRMSGFEPEWTREGLEWGYRAGHADDMEYGTDPFVAEFQPLLEWAERQGGGYGLATYVWQKIAREGITAQPFVGPGRDAQERWYQSKNLDDYLDQEL